MLASIGDLVADIVAAVADGQAADATWASDTDASITVHRGGSAANVAAVAARLGLPSRFVGRVAPDLFGLGLMHQLRGVGVDTTYVQVEAGRTATIVARIDPDGERHFLTDRGNAVALQPPEPGWADGVQWVHLPAYSLFGGEIADASRELIVLAHKARIPVSIDTSSTALIAQLGPSALHNLLADLQPSILFSNDAQARALGWFDAVEPPAPLTFITQGARPTIVIDRTTPLLATVPVIARGVVDTTGAGDAFVASILYSILTKRTDGHRIVQAVEFAHRVAGLVIGGPGADYWPESGLGESGQADS